MRNIPYRLEYLKRCAQLTVLFENWGLWRKEANHWGWALRVYNLIPLPLYCPSCVQVKVWLASFLPLMLCLCLHVGLEPSRIDGTNKLFSPLRCFWSFYHCVRKVADPGIQSALASVLISQCCPPPIPKSPCGNRWHHSGLERRYSGKSQNPKHDFGH